MAETKRERIARLKKEAEEKAQKLQEKMKNAIGDTDTSDPTDELIEEFEGAKEEAAPVPEEVQKDVEEVPTVETPAVMENAEESVAIKNVPPKKNSKSKEKAAKEVSQQKPENPVEEPEAQVNELVEVAVEGETVEKSANEVKIKLNFSTYKREAKSCKKMILIKPSTNENVDVLLKNVCGGMSFNELVNQLLEGWVEDVNNQLK